MSIDLRLPGCHVLGIPRGGPLPMGPPTGPPSLAEAVDGFERALIAAELGRQAGNLTRTAAALGVPKTTLHDKLRKHGLSSP